MKKLAHQLKEKYIQNFIFIHINKTAGSSVQKALGIPHEHKTALEKIAELGESAWKRKFKFCIVRNPWDKVVSHYHFRVQTDQTGLKSSGIDFKTWVDLTYRQKNTQFYDKPKMFMPQFNWISNEEGELLVDYVAHFEDLENDLQQICKKIGRPSISLPHEKKSNRGCYKEYYDEKTAETVEKWFARDIHQFNYRF